MKKTLIWVARPGWRWGQRWGHEAEGWRRKTFVLQHKKTRLPSNLRLMAHLLGDSENVLLSAKKLETC